MFSEINIKKADRALSASRQLIAAIPDAMASSSEIERFLKEWYDVKVGRSITLLFLRLTSASRIDTLKPQGTRLTTTLSLLMRKSTGTYVSGYARLCFMYVTIPLFFSLSN